MLTNRSTRIKVLEDGVVWKVIPNATINFGLDFITFKKMVNLAIRLSPQDPLFDVTKLTIHGKADSKDFVIDCSDPEAIDENELKNSIRKIVVSLPTHDPISISVDVTRPLVEVSDNQRPKSIQRPTKQSRPSFGLENCPPSADARQSPARKFQNSPAKGRGSSIGSIRSNTPNLRGRPSPARTKTPKRINLPVTAPKERAQVTSVKKIEKEEELIDNSSLEHESADIQIESIYQEDEIVEQTSMPSNVPFNSTDEDEDDDNDGAWKFVEGSSPNPDSPECIQSFKPFQNTKSCLKSTIAPDLLAEDMYVSVSKPSRQSIINEDDFHTPNATPVALHDDDSRIVSSMLESLNLSKEEFSKTANTDTKDSTEESVSHSDDESVPSINEEESVISNDSLKNRRGKTPDRRAIKQPISVTKQTKQSTRPVYTDGMTAGEAARAFDNSLRNYDKTPIGRKSVISPHRRGDRKSSFVGTNSARKSTSKDKDGDSLSPLLGNKSSRHGPDGRPSTGTMERQWEFMRAHFINNADDELEWLMVSKNKGAYKYAKRKHDEAEDKYFKALYETEISEKCHKRAMQADGVGVILPKLISQFSELHKPLSVNPNDEASIATFRETQLKLQTVLESIENDKEISYMRDIFNMKTQYALKTLSIEPSDKALKAVRKARELTASLPAELSQLPLRITQSQRIGDSALEDMEKWSKRMKETDEYLSVMKQEEEDWLARELVANTEALCVMRGYLPTNITDISVNELMNEAKRQGGLFSLDLANEMKNNRLLHWLITHKDDIAISNFLVGDKKQYFENIEGLDIIEIRALILCLPEKFELDADGKKNEWRNRVFARAKQMVAQLKEETVKGGWDGKSNKRLAVKLPMLKPEQLRRSVYFYRTMEQCQTRIKQYNDKEALLVKKTNWLTAAQKASDEAKREYDTILNEMRDPDLKAQYGAEQFTMAKDLAKREWMAADSKRKSLEREVDQLKKTIASAPISKESFIESMNEIEAYLADKDITWNTPDLAPVQIEGVFDPVPDIVRTERQAAKFVSAEQEAEQRKKELSELMAKKEAAYIASTSEETAVTLGNILDAAEGIYPAPSSDQPINAESSDVSANTFAVPTDLPTKNGTAFSDYREALLNQSTPNVTILSPPRKRVGSILDTTNPALLNCLNNMFSPDRASFAPGGLKGAGIQSTPIAARRGTMLSPTTPKGSLLAGNDKEDRKETKTTRSKLLQKLIGGGNEAASETPSKSVPSFLDQLKAKQNNANPGPKPSFLDQLKARSAPSTSSEDGENVPPPSDNTESSFPPAPPSKPRIALGGASFLDAIKSRRVE